jgi:hypothetical protein
MRRQRNRQCDQLLYAWNDARRLREFFQLMLVG